MITVNAMTMPRMTVAAVSRNVMMRTHSTKMMRSPTVMTLSTAFCSSVWPSKGRVIYACVRRSCRARAQALVTVDNGGSQAEGSSNATSRSQQHHGTARRPYSREARRYDYPSLCRTGRIRHATRVGEASKLSRLWSTYPIDAGGRQ